MLTLAVVLRVFLMGFGMEVLTIGEQLAFVSVTFCVMWMVVNIIQT